MADLQNLNKAVDIGSYTQRILSGDPDAITELATLATPDQTGKMQVSPEQLVQIQQILKDYNPGGTSSKEMDALKGLDIGGATGPNPRPTGTPIPSGHW